MNQALPTEPTALGWPAHLVGELDHRRLKAPSLKLRSARQGPRGDWIHCVDLRVRRPNAGASLAPAAAHSLEHFLLYGLQRRLPDHFVAVGVMGCGTGFYLTFMNEGRAATLCSVLAEVLGDIRYATAVPYANVAQCGNHQNHDLAAARRLADEILAGRSHWLDAA